MEVSVLALLGELRLQHEEHRLVIDLEKLFPELADRLPKSQCTRADNMDTLDLLVELGDLLESLQDVTVGSDRGGGLEGVGIVHKEGARLLVGLCGLDDLSVIPVPESS